MGGSSLKAAVFVIHIVTDFSIMKRGTEPFLRPLRRQEEPNMADVLAQVERSGRIYFVKTLSKTAIQTHEAEKTAVLSLPANFVRENAKKIERWVILRTHASCGGSGRPWAVQLSISEAGKVLICGGFYDFVTDNRLREGDSMIFVLQEDARSEFEVYTFRGSRGVPLYADEEDIAWNSASSDEENNSHSNFPSPLHHRNERKKAFTRDTREGRATPSQFASHFDYHRVHKKVPTSDTREGRTTRSQFASHFDYHHVHKKVPISDTREGMATRSQFSSHFDYHRVHKKVPTRYTREGRVTPLQNAKQWHNQGEIPCFRKRLTASNIGRYDRHPSSNSGQFEFPERFLRTFGKQVQTPVKLQGIHEDSPTHVLPCRQRPGTRLRVDFLVTGWNRFVKENGLEKGDELQFSLMADSYFVVRKVY